MSSVKKKLPPDVVIIKNGQVVSLDEWTWWDLNPVISLTARRLIVNSENSDEFYVFNILYLEVESKPQTGKTIEEAANKALPPEYSNHLITLFKLENPTEDQIRKTLRISDNGLEVIFQN